MSNADNMRKLLTQMDDFAEKYGEKATCEVMSALIDQKLHTYTTKPQTATAYQLLPENFQKIEEAFDCKIDMFEGLAQVWIATDRHNSLNSIGTWMIDCGSGFDFMSDEDFREKYDVRQ